MMLLTKIMLVTMVVMRKSGDDGDGCDIDDDGWW